MAVSYLAFVHMLIEHDRAPAQAKRIDPIGRQVGSPSDRALESTWLLI